LVEVLRTAASRPRGRRCGRRPRLVNGGWRGLRVGLQPASVQRVGPEIDRDDGSPGTTLRVMGLSSPDLLVSLTCSMTWCAGRLGSGGRGRSRARRRSRSSRAWPARRRVASAWSPRVDVAGPMVHREWVPSKRRPPLLRRRRQAIEAWAGHGLAQAASSASLHCSSVAGGGPALHRSGRRPMLADVSDVICLLIAIDSVSGLVPGAATTPHRRDVGRPPLRVWLETRSSSRRPRRSPQPAGLGSQSATHCLAQQASRHGRRRRHDRPLGRRVTVTG
jgi:hypothetical protein